MTFVSPLYSTGTKVYNAQAAAPICTAFLLSFLAYCESLSRLLTKPASQQTSGEGPIKFLEWYNIGRVQYVLPRPAVA